MAVAEQDILDLLSSPRYHPMRRSEIARALDAPADDRPDLRRTLRDLVDRGEVAVIRHNRYVRAREADLVSGTIQVADRGFGFLTPDSGGDELYISADHTSTAMHRDRVLVRRIERPRRKPGVGDMKPEGKVIRVLERARDTVVGTLRRSRHFYYVIPDEPRLIHDIYVPAPPSELNAEPGTKVVARLQPWENRHVSPEGEIIEVLGRADDPGVEMTALVRRHRLPRGFPEAAAAEAAAFGSDPAPADQDGRVDLRHLELFTIDPEDARDHDDAVSIEALPDGGWNLGVHIADVSAYVSEGSAIDTEAADRGVSVYLADRVIPMLPEALSAGICSLRQDEDRLARTVFIRIDAKHKPVSHTIQATLIRSRRTFSYAQVQSVLDGDAGTASPDQADALRSMAELAQGLRADRVSRGALDLDMPEVRVRVDASGRPAGLTTESGDASHQLIEEFMVLANRTVARHLLNAKYPAIYRVHDAPVRERLQEFGEFVRTLGVRTGDVTRREGLQAVLNQVRGTPHEYLVKIAALRSMNRALYGPKPLAHFGLAVRPYLHFTSPIRRYADLVVHRILVRCLAGQPPGYNVSQLERLSLHTSRREQLAEEAERDSRDLMKMAYLARQIEEHELEVYDAVVTDIRNFGMFVELPALQVSGLVHIGQLGDEFFRFDRARRALAGKSSGRRYRVGDRLRVLPYRIDAHKRQYDFALAGD